MGALPIPQEFYADIIQAYQAGDSLRDIASRYVAAPSTISRILRRCDVSVRPAGNPRVDRQATRDAAPVGGVRALRARYDARLRDGDNNGED